MNPCDPWLVGRFGMHSGVEGQESGQSGQGSGARVASRGQDMAACRDRLKTCPTVMPTYGWQQRRNPHKNSRPRGVSTVFPFVFTAVLLLARKPEACLCLGTRRSKGISELRFSKSRSVSSFNDTSNPATAVQGTTSRPISEPDPCFPLNSFRKPCCPCATYVGPARRKLVTSLGGCIRILGSRQCGRDRSTGDLDQ